MTSVPVCVSVYVGGGGAGAIGGHVCIGVHCCLFGLSCCIFTQVSLICYIYRQLIKLGNTVCSSRKAYVITVSSGDHLKNDYKNTKEKELYLWPLLTSLITLFEISNYA